MWKRQKLAARQQLVAPPVRPPQQHYLAINGKTVPRVRVFVAPSAWQAYKDLQSYVLPRENLFYLVRRKHAFNTVAFQQAYDVLICDREFRLIAIHANQQPGYISDYYPQAYFIFFAPAHTANFYELQLNDRVQLVRAWFGKL